MGYFFQNCRSICCSFRGSMLIMVLCLKSELHGVSRWQLLEAVRPRDLPHGPHHGRGRLGLWRLLRFFYRDGNRSSSAFGGKVDGGVPGSKNKPKPPRRWSSWSFSSYRRAAPLGRAGSRPWPQSLQTSVEPTAPAVARAWTGRRLWARRCSS